MYEAKTARAGSSAICAGTLVSLLPRDAHTMLQPHTASQHSVRSCSIACEHLESDTNVPAQMADEPARAVLALYVSHN